MMIPIRTGEPPVMSFIKRAKILATRVYEFFEGGNVDTIANSPDKLVWRTNRTTFSDLRKSSIHQAFCEFVVHTPRLVVLFVRSKAPPPNLPAKQVTSPGRRGDVTSRKGGNNPATWLKGGREPSLFICTYRPGLRLGGQAA